MASNQFNVQFNQVQAVRKQWDNIIYQASIYAKEILVKTNPTALRSLLISMACIESNGNQWAMRPEWHYREAILRGKKPPVPDKLINAYCSHSIWQIMGVHSSDYKDLGTLYLSNGKPLITCGTLPHTINDFYLKPALVVLAYLKKNCEPYLSSGDFEKVVRIYNGGSPTASFLVTNNYVRDLKIFMNLANESLKKSPTL